MNNDLISREALKEAIETQDKFACLPDTKLVPFLMLNEPEKNYEPYVHLRDILNAIDNAPTVQAFTLEDMQNNFDAGVDSVIGKYDKAEGEWIHYLGCGIGKAVCSECGQVGETKKYCENCGVRMKGDKE